MWKIIDENLSGLAISKEPSLSKMDFLLTDPDAISLYARTENGSIDLKIGSVFTFTKDMVGELFDAFDN